MESSKQVIPVFDKLAPLYQAEYKEKSDHLDAFLSHLQRNAKILDVACGVGVDAAYMKAKGYNVIGVDLSKEMLKLAKAKAPGVDFREMDMTALEFATSDVDGIVLSYALNYIPKTDVINVLKDAYRFLKRRGILYIAVQQGTSSEVTIDSPLNPKLKVFVNIISIEELTALLQQAGFAILEKHQREASESKGSKELHYSKLIVIARAV